MKYAIVFASENWPGLYTAIRHTVQCGDSIRQVDDLLRTHYNTRERAKALALLSAHRELLPTLEETRATQYDKDAFPDMLIVTKKDITNPDSSLFQHDTTFIYDERLTYLGTCWRVCSRGANLHDLL